MPAASMLLASVTSFATCDVTDDVIDVEPPIQCDVIGPNVELPLPQTEDAAVDSTTVNTDPHVQYFHPGDVTNQSTTYHSASQCHDQSPTSVTSLPSSPQGGAYRSSSSSSSSDDTIIIIIIM